MSRDLSDPGDLQDLHFADTRGLRYAELAIVSGPWVSFYNSTGLSEAPAELWDPLDADTVARDLDATMVIKNGPHWWAADGAVFRWGTEVLDVGGMGFRWASNISAEIVSSGGLAEGIYYDPRTADKRGELSYRAGNPVFELVAPGGDVYVMQSSNLEIDGFESLGDRLDLAEGWTFGTRILDDDLRYVMDGDVGVVMDDLRNVYNRLA